MNIEEIADAIRQCRDDGVVIKAVSIKHKQIRQDALAKYYGSGFERKGKSEVGYK